MNKSILIDKKEDKALFNKVLFCCRVISKDVWRPELTRVYIEMYLGRKSLIASDGSRIHAFFLKDDTEWETGAYLVNKSASLITLTAIDDGVKAPNWGKVTPDDNPILFDNFTVRKLSGQDSSQLFRLYSIGFLVDYSFIQDLAVTKNVLDFWTVRGGETLKALTFQLGDLFAVIMPMQKD